MDDAEDGADDASAGPGADASGDGGPGDDAVDPLYAISPLDGRYADRMGPLRPYAGEAALTCARVRVEVEYLLALADLEATPLALSNDDRAALRGLYREFDAADARRIKRIETEGTDDRPATNHDVKAVEYFVRDALTGDRPTDAGDADAESTGGGAEPIAPDATQWVHFGLTSADVNNLARRLLAKGAVTEVLVPELEAVRDELAGMAREHRDLPMLARTHGQPATPTTFGKEVAVFAARLGRTLGGVREAVGGLTGKLAGASGTYAAHHVAYPDVDWPAFAASFVEGLGFGHEPLATQIHPCDDLAALFDALRRVNAVLLDIDRDAWRYVSDGYLGQRAAEGETGSSTMPHKVNPIDFENSEGNLAKANADLRFLADYVAGSRLQRDLTDSTVKRNVGAALGHCLLGYGKLRDGLAKVTPNAEAMAADLEAHPEVLGEAVQTVLRREGHGDAYERVKEATRGRDVTLEDLRAVVEDLEVDEAVREELASLTPAEYTGLAADLVDELE